MKDSALLPLGVERVSRPAGRRLGAGLASAAAVALLFVGCWSGGRGSAPEPAGQSPQGPEEDDSAFEAAQTQKLLGVALREFPPPQGPAGFDELPADAPVFRFAVTERKLSGAAPQPSYEPRPSVEARAPDGTVYEAFCGHPDSEELAPGHGIVSTPFNTRQRYGTHHGYAYNPQDVFVGRREAGRLRPSLFFRDVGSHTTAPHHLAVDSRGLAYLAVADVNISQGNRLDLYWAAGDPRAGKWESLWLVDRRGFTSWSHPWSAAWGDRVHLLWTWCDVSINKRAPGMGAFHVEWGPGGFGRKVRVVAGVVQEWGAALDPQTGRILVVFSKDDGVYVLSRPAGGGWTRAARLHPGLRKRREVSVEAAAGGAFVIRTNVVETREWVLRPL